MSQYLDWKVGDRVVFVGGERRVRVHYANWRRFLPGLDKVFLSHRLVTGEVYEIEAMTKYPDMYTGENVVCVFVHGQHFRENIKAGFPAEWFRKIEPRATDIAIFTAMLHGTDTKVTGKVEA